MKSFGADKPVVLDTTAYSRLRGSDQRVVAALAAAPAVLVSAVVLGELEAGFALGSRSRENRQVLREFLSEPFVSVIPVTPQESERYGALFAALRTKGTPVPTNDIWIAAAAAVHNAWILTFDAHFNTIAESGGPEVMHLE